MGVREGRNKKRKKETLGRGEKRREGESSDRGLEIKAVCCAVAGNSEKRGCGRGIDSPSGHSRTILPPESLTMLNGNASNNSAMNNGTLERELLNRDRKNSRISAFQPESSLRVARFVAMNVPRSLFSLASLPRHETIHPRAGEFLRLASYISHYLLLSASCLLMSVNRCDRAGFSMRLPFNRVENGARVRLLSVHLVVILSLFMLLILWCSPIAGIHSAVLMSLFRCSFFFIAFDFVVFSLVEFVLRCLSIASL